MILLVHVALYVENRIRLLSEARNIGNRKGG